MVFAWVEIGVVGQIGFGMGGKSRSNSTAMGPAREPDHARPDERSGVNLIVIEPQLESAALWGRLEEVGLLEICQVLLHRIGLVRVDAIGMGGSIYLRDGKINRVSWGALKGRDAFLELALLTDGEFQFYPGIITEEANNDMHPERMILEAALYLDHWSALWEHEIGPLTIISRRGYRASAESRIFDHESKIEVWNILHDPMSAGEVVMRLAETRGLDRIEVVKAVHFLFLEETLDTEQPEEYSETPTIQALQKRRGLDQFWEGFKSVVQSRPNDLPAVAQGAARP